MEQQEVLVTNEETTMTEQQKAILAEYENALLNNLNTTCNDFVEACRGAAIPPADTHACLTFHFTKGLCMLLVSTTKMTDGDAGKMLARDMEYTRLEVEQAKATARTTH
jgi:hypothetical protein